jgi:ribosomal protein L28
VGCGFGGKKGRIGGDVSRKKRKEKKRKKTILQKV